MCLAVPGVIEQVSDDAALRMGTVSFEGLRRAVCLACVPEAGVGDWVIVHAGFAISVLDAGEAEAVLAELRALTEDAP